MSSNTIRKDMTGERYGRLTVVKLACHGSKNTPAKWLCKCDCGNYTEVRRAHLVNGNIKSCGCYNRENSKKVHTKHDKSYSKLYRIWAGMKARCNNPKNTVYKYYGGKGVRVCEEWLDSSNFIKWALENGYKEGLTIDRIDSNGIYEPSNCRWATMKVQNNNTSQNHFETINGVRRTISEWADFLGVRHEKIYYYKRKYKCDIVKAILILAEERGLEIG